MPRDADATRRKLILAARRHFASVGYERATVRAIAADAEVNPALINRYFGGKEQLFAEAVSIDLGFPDLTDVPRQAIGKTLVRHFFRRWEGNEADDLLRVLIRTAATNPEAAERIRGIFSGQIIALVERLAGPELAGRRAALIATQILGLAYARYVLALPREMLSPEIAIAAIGGTLQRYLFDPLDPCG